MLKRPSSKPWSRPSSRPWMRVADGIVLDVRLTPRSARDAIEGIECRADGRAVLKARVRAAPVEGEANEALRRLIAKELGIAPRQVDVAGGAPSARGSAANYRRCASPRRDAATVGEGK